MSTLSDRFPIRFQCVGGAVVTVTARPGRMFGREFSLSCSGCGLTHLEQTDDYVRHWSRVRRARVLASEAAHFETLAWNAMHVLANGHAASCRRIP